MRSLKAILNGKTLAESDETILLEGNHYFPAEAVRHEHLSKTRVRTLCPWKGIATYYSLEAGRQEQRYAAWSYGRPWPWIRKIRGHVAFSPTVEIRN